MSGTGKILEGQWRWELERLTNLLKNGSVDTETALKMVAELRATFTAMEALIPSSDGTSDADKELPAEKIYSKPMEVGEAIIHFVSEVRKRPQTKQQIQDGVLAGGWGGSLGDDEAGRASIRKRVSQSLKFHVNAKLLRLVNGKYGTPGMPKAWYS